MKINLNTADYATIIRTAEELGYRRSLTALERETDIGSVGQFGITLDEACDYLIRAGHADNSQQVTP